jgi:hypothetical protein
MKNNCLIISKNAENCFDKNEKETKQNMGTKQILNKND